jgi:hypothetical protein
MEGNELSWLGPIAPCATSGFGYFPERAASGGSGEMPTLGSCPIVFLENEADVANTFPNARHLPRPSARFVEGSCSYVPDDLGLESLARKEGGWKHAGRHGLPQQR